MRDYKLVVLGAGGVGKSSLTVQFVQGVYLDTYDPTIEDSYRKTIEVDNKVFDLEILDTAGVAQFAAMRELYIKSGMGFLLVYSVTDPQSLRELMEVREQVMRIKDSNRVPMVLVGNKADLVDDRTVSVEDGIEVSSKWGRVPFYETSALLRSNIDEVFVDLVRQIIIHEMENVANKFESRNTSQTLSNNPNFSQDVLKKTNESRTLLNASSEGNVSVNQNTSKKFNSSNESSSKIINKSNEAIGALDKKVNKNLSKDNLKSAQTTKRGPSLESKTDKQKSAKVNSTAKNVPTKINRELKSSKKKKNSACIIL